MGEMDAAEFDDVVDDWFIESLKTYKDLHVYQLEHPTRVIEWTSGKTVCVAGYRSAKNELLELLLPLKLLAEENKGLCAERDFKVVHGGFAEGPVHCLRHIPGTRCAVTNDGRSSGLQVWDLGGDDSDVIRRTASVAGRSASGRGSRIAAGLSSDPRVLHGAESSDVLLTDLTSGQSVYKLKSDAADPLSSLQFVSDSVFLACCCSGNIYTVDTRASDAPRPSPPPATGGGDGVLWCADASPSSAGGAGRVARLSSSGEAVLSDLRDLGGAVSRARLDVLIDHHNWDDVKVSWAPALDDCIAASGFSGTVQIYDTSAWAAEPAAARPLFEHRGHVVSSQRADSLPVLVTSHVWHPERPRTLLSAAADGSVHVWDWVDQSAAAC
ncbi:integrator complex assembly factor WDR73 [Myripristis murdjan]|uniref:WD repeat domain 73 n=1 Tax=Myripristis murdjan TaxID=586833 RepID=A0A667YGE3_9TELE|nr:WD repeat-containing protein 73 [Myripristis murdjan]XP_029927561.1 WD repeat-containing protein 73 [Myripristis murdjan]XP_029927562.1 WD repeat-containing protein 73 [Myripristis murdjan]